MKFLFANEIQGKSFEMMKQIALWGMFHAKEVFCIILPYQWGFEMCCRQHIVDNNKNN